MVDQGCTPLQDRQINYFNAGCFTPDNNYNWYILYDTILNSSSRLGNCEEDVKLGGRYEKVVILAISSGLQEAEDGLSKRQTKT